MIATIPKLQELGIHWATLDDRWFNNYGDWQQILLVAAPSEKWWTISTRKR
jgi:hypothetical protein